MALVLLILGSTILLANHTRQSTDMENLRSRFNAVFDRKNDLSDRFLIFLDYRVSLRPFGQMSKRPESHFPGQCPHKGPMGGGLFFKL